MKLTRPEIYKIVNDCVTSKNTSAGCRLRIKEEEKGNSDRQVVLHRQTNR
jgi:hypothetical protein